MRRNSTAIRVGRVASQIRKEVSHIVEFEARDELLKGVIVIDVEVSADLRHSRIYVNHMDGSSVRGELMERLDRATGFIRFQLSRRMRLRRMPDIRFIYDDTQDRGFRVDAILKEISDGKE